MIQRRRWLRSKNNQHICMHHTHLLYARVMQDCVQQAFPHTSCLASLGTKTANLLVKQIVYWLIHRLQFRAFNWSKQHNTCILHIKNKTINFEYLLQYLHENCIIIALPSNTPGCFLLCMLLPQGGARRQVQKVFC